MDVPVVVTAFNRPDCCFALYKAIKCVSPKKLFIISDAARPGVDGEKALVAESRLIFENPTWDCEIKPLYAEENEGPRDRIINGLNEVFSRVDRAVILEHDCIPDGSFFSYAECLLDKYADDERVMNICGNKMHQVVAGENS
jgi:hypothetical protein